MNQERLKQIIEGKIWNYLRAEIVSVDEEKSLIRLPLKEEFNQLHGNVHGGIIATLADMAMAVAVNTTVSENEYAVTAEMKVNYLRPASGNYLTAKGEIIKRGKTLSHCRAEIMDENNKQVSFATATFYMFEK